jgi:hypothetical protein
MCLCRAALPFGAVFALAGMLVVFLGTGCAPSEPEPSTAGPSPARDYNPLRNAYFGDLHVHTVYSFDAFIFTTRSTPDDAYRYARGEAIDHPLGYTMQLAGGPLDFQAVTDHAEFLGILRAMADPSQEISEHPLAAHLTGATTAQESREVFGGLRDLLGPDGQPKDSELLDLDIVASAWKEIRDAADRHYEPGVFTTFSGFEYTSGPDSQNLHRNVIFRGSAAPELPFSMFDSENPEDLWAWMDANRARGMEAIAIPHNSNGSNGQMFKLETFDGKPLDGGYAETRMLNEPIVEMSQVKGTSEVHPLLSPNDEWADFEIFPYRIGAALPSQPKGGYVREAYLNGLVMEEEGGFNPFRFGMIGSTDTHNSAGTPEEFKYHSKIGILDGTPERRGSVPLAIPRDDGGRYADSYYQLWGASGLAGVWAEENTREAIFDAMRRKETFATSGPRIRIRFFAGFDFDDGLASDPDMIAGAYEGGVSMGGDLASDGDRVPRFLVWVTRDPNSAPLQRLQIIKGWVEDGEARERVFDVACSDGLEPDPASHRCPDNGATVDLSDCSISTDVGAAELHVLWTDPEFEAEERAFYYVRVLENPKCRWSTWDAIRAGVEPRTDLPATIQDRAWSSPIWFVPMDE